MVTQAVPGRARRNLPLATPSVYSPQRLRLSPEPVPQRKLLVRKTGAVNAAILTRRASWALPRECPCQLRRQQPLEPHKGHAALPALDSLPGPYEYQRVPARLR